MFLGLHFHIKLADEVRSKSGVVSLAEKKGFITNEVELLCFIHGLLPNRRNLDMKFMKLGARPDTFYTTESVGVLEHDGEDENSLIYRSVSSEVSSDLIVQVKGIRYLLHKFPLLSKCLRLQKLCSESPDQIIQLPDFPVGVESFELCAKFCYGITITLSAYNIVSVRCAAEYLQMTENAEKGNLVYKMEVFFNSCILKGWRDSIVTLQSTKSFRIWSEDLEITSRCIEAIASKVRKYPSKAKDEKSCNGAEIRGPEPAITKSWWAEDIADLGIEIYWRTIIAIRSGGKFPSNLIGEALQVYASRWLPKIFKKGFVWNEELISRHRLFLESTVSLLPGEKGSVPCRFLCKLLKAANVLEASSSSSYSSSSSPSPSSSSSSSLKVELIRRIGIQLEEARVNDLLIPSLSDDPVLYDVDLVLSILEQFMLQGHQSPSVSPPRGKEKIHERMRSRRRSRSAENVDFEFQENRRSSSSAPHSSKLKVAKLVDGYLQEIAGDPNLPPSKVVSLAGALPDFAWLDHDGLYNAIDIYLKAHPDISKSERKQVCQILDCRKLSMEACMHAAQNELLPLRMVVQVLFFEQTRAAMAGGKVTELPLNIKAVLAAHGFEFDPSRPRPTLSTTTSTKEDDYEWSIAGLKSPKGKKSTLKMKLAEEDEEEEDNSLNCHASSSNVVGKTSMFKAFCAIPSRPKRMFSKLWSTNGGAAEKR